MMKSLPQNVKWPTDPKHLAGGFGGLFDRQDEVPEDDADWHETPANTPEEVPSGEQEL